jgi:hypothetical protein
MALQALGMCRDGHEMRLLKKDPLLKKALEVGIPIWHTQPAFELLFHYPLMITPNFYQLIVCEQL